MADRPAVAAAPKNPKSLTGLLLKCDQSVQTKRKMLLDIERENLGTLLSQLRSTTKKPKEEKDPSVNMFG